MTAATLLWALTVAALIQLAGLGLGALALRPLRLGEPGLLGLWLRAAAGLGLLAVLTMLLAFAGLLFRALVVPLVFGLAAAGAWAIWGAVRAHRAARPPWAPEARAWPVRALLALLLALGATSWLWILLTHSLAPPIDWDVLAYHMDLPKRYVAAHRFVYVADNPSSNWPLNIEMLFALALLFGSELAANLVTLSLVGLAACGLLAVGRRLFDDRAGIVAFALFLTVPTVKRLGGVAMVDAAMGLFVLGAAFSFERWARGRQAGWLALCAIFCGVVSGSKLTGAGFAILYFLLLLWEEGRRLLRERAGGLRPAWGLLVRNALIYGLVGLALVGPWYLRSVINTGNPVFPFAYGVFGGRNWDALGDEYHSAMLESVFTAEIPKDLVGLARSYYYMIVEPAKLGGYRGHLGALITLGMLAGLLLLPWSPRFVRHSLFVCAAFWVQWFFLTSHQARFVLPLAPLLSLVTGYIIVRALDALRRPALQAALLGLLALAVVPEWPWYYAGERALFASRVPYLTGAQSRAAFLDAHVDAMPLFRFVNQQLPEDSRVLLVPYESRGYYLERPYLWGHPIGQRVVRWEQYDSAEQLLVDLRGLGVTHVLENPRWIYTDLRYWDRTRALMLDLEARCADPLFSDGGGGAVLALTPACRR
jgi:4-amino-4-deoxy-L-arabinose transferase-like glycosyltransferase